MARRRRVSYAPKETPDHVHEFDTWAEFIAYASREPKWSPDNPQYGSHGTGGNREHFTGTATFEDASRLALYGWPAGRENLVNTIAIVNPERTTYQSHSYDVAGEYPNVPRAIAGDPMSMVRQRRTHIASHPVVRIDYNVTVPWMLNADCIVNRGAALLSVVDALESRGYSCELRLIFKGYSQTKRIHISIVYKRAGDALDLDRAAFAVTHPSVLRRFYFAVCEQHSDLRASFANNGYGQIDKSPWDKDPSSIFVPPADSSDEDPNYARERMNKLFVDYLEN